MPKGPSIFRFCLTTMYLVGAGIFVYFLLKGGGYYLTPYSERPYHEDYRLLRPAGEWGLAFGLVGTVLLLSLLLYSLRRRTRLFGQWVPLKYWLHVHISFGIFGPLAILLHTSFKWTGLVSVSFWSMVGVALSGVFGRYLYIQIPRNVHGEELALGSQAGFDHQLRHHLANFPELPEGSYNELLRNLHGRFDLRTDLLHMMTGDLTRFLGTRRASRFLAQFRLSHARIKQLISGVNQVEAQRRAAIRLGSLHRVLHQWHLIHRPFALIMYLIMIVHITVALLFGISWR